MHLDQLALDVEVATRLVHEQFSDGVVALIDTTATTSFVFRVGETYLARFPMQPADADAHRRGLEIEREVMDEFAQVSTVPSPRLVFVGRPDLGYPMPWSVQTWIPGEIATPDSVASSVLFAKDVTRLVKALRAVDVGGRVFSGAGRGGVLTDHDTWVAYCLKQSETLLPVDRLTKAWGALRTTPKVGRDVMSHKDLTPFNLVVERDRLAGVLDTGGFGPADPALDLVAAWHLFDADARAEFRQSVGAGDVEWRRGAGWALQQALGLVWYYSTTNSRMSHLGRSTIGRILASSDLGI